MAVFKGSAVAIITPFNNDGSINFEQFGALIDYQIAHKTDAIVVMGTTGEASTLTHEEHIECIRFCVERVAGRVPVIAGTGSNCTETAMYLTKAADEAGADAMLVVTPYYNKATQKGLINHFTMIAGSTEKPIILYNIPGRTGCKMSPDTVAKLYKDVPNIVGVKDATGDFSEIAKLMSMVDEEFSLYSGNDDQIVPMLALGGSGVISVLAHCAPEETHEMVMSFLNGDVKRAKELQLKYIPLIKALFCEVNPIPAKAACQMMGFCGSTMRAPLTEMEEDNQVILWNELRKLDIVK
ncbi:MAG: 4-hydroxy-tetrahydrodipicolinate synthase [Lachnospiraceae bacterium]|nr:4-hydroxy-tetrahydrodipicolinate synthase [Lachnospiraceae bacterium]